MKNIIKEPKITLVGAGPGDPELLTIKGLKAIQSADVIIYDALVNEDLLKEAPDAIKIYAGKRKGHKAMSQKEINKLIVESALQYGHVVRLKGGDSFVFGRGFEEIQFIRMFGIQAEVIPGISSCIAVPALANIPVSHRGINTHFTVVTATLSDGSLNPEINSIAELNGTVVILMGLSKLQEIAEIYQRIGKESIPMAVISKGSTKEQQTIFSQAKNIHEHAEKIQSLSPAVIVIGEAVKLGESTSNFQYFQNYLN